MEENIELSQERLHNERILAWSICEFMETPKMAFHLHQKRVCFKYVIRGTYDERFMCW
jgi:hypothetical protein